jgi:hypothetical protein
MRCVSLLTLSSAVLLLTQPVRASPWLAEAGGGQLITATIATYSSDGFESVPNPSGLPRFTLCTHFEYGVARDATAIFDAEFQRFSPGDLNFGTSGYRLDKAMTGIRLPLLRRQNTILSVEGMFGTDAVYDNTPRSIFASTRGAAEARLMLGQNLSFFGLNSFATLEVGGRWRAGPPADEATLDATFGIAPTKRSLLLLQSFSTVSVDAAEAPYRRYLLSKAQLSAAYRMYGGVWLQVGGYGTVAHAHTGAERGGLLSIWWKF